MDNKINFTGLKNIGACAVKAGHIGGQFEKCNMHLLVQLTDDFNGKELTEFKNIIRNCSPKFKYNKLEGTDDFVNIATRTVTNNEVEFDYNIPQLLINGMEVPAKRKTLPLFSFIAKITKKISQMTNKEFVVNKDFKYGPDGAKYIIPGSDISDLGKSTQEHKMIMDKTYSPEVARFYANEINLNIQKQMEEYLK